MDNFEGLSCTRLLEVKPKIPVSDWTIELKLAKLRCQWIFNLRFLRIKQAKRKLLAKPDQLLYTLQSNDNLCQGQFALQVQVLLTF